MIRLPLYQSLQKWPPFQAINPFLRQLAKSQRLWLCLALVFLLTVFLSTNLIPDKVSLRVGDVSPEVAERLQIFTRTEDGFEIAREDLRMRGLGDLFGERQSGVPTFRIADPLRDEELNDRARTAAIGLLSRDSGLDPGAMPVAELIARCPAPERRGRADFAGNLRRWLDCFPRERLMIGFHDEIESDPVGFLERLGGFIGVGAMPDRVRELAVERVNSSARDLPSPAAVERHGAERFAGQAEIMARRAGGPALAGLERIRNIARVKHA
jgi:hypothetical protein